MPQPRGTVFFDIETFDADLLYSMPADEFVRLIGYRWLGDDLRITTNLDELLDQLDKARWIIGHNIHAFDLKAVFGPDSNVPLELADAGRVYDTFTHAGLVNPAPAKYVNRHGKNALALKPEQMTKWFSLDEQAFQLGVPGKTDDLKVLAKEFGDPELIAKERVKDGYGKIPVDDPRYVAYLEGDVIASQAVSKELLKLGPLNDYAMREQRIAARAAVISSNGFRVDREKAQARVDELAARREVIMDRLVEKYDFPTTGKAPWSSAEGKAAIIAALADEGITPKSRPEWPISAKTGAPGLGGEVLINLTKGTGAEELGQALAELKGQRSLAQLALDSCHPDGFAHPRITMLQRSGRWSTTDPGLTIWTSRGEGAVEKAYFIPDWADEVLLAIDYSQADARIVAALSGDTKFAERFEPGADGHMINAIAGWGAEVVATDPAGYRQKAKIPGHGWNYRGGPAALSKQSGLPFEDAKRFVEGMNREYTALVRWQDKASKEARRGYVMGEWGRKMYVEKGREYTQGPALKGQNGTREIVCDALLKMPYGVLRTVKAQVHDELIFSIPLEKFEEYKSYLVELMTTTISPRQGQEMKFPVSTGPPGNSWWEATHE